ncbi:DNA mismatch repair protein MutS [Segetibacter sp.]|uniref:MutS-related protein n=1 Tax=Segetibacter sp. TaxID=2231182 RepID=UPI0026305026|nr:DNA mismatch repair protein MutS [Segetibacter sp.]MCW3079150.1 mismatch repair protein MutS [Segetibacter sp.]
MQADKTTIHDLAIFHREEEQSVFHHLDLTTTVGGREWFRYFLANPYSDLQKIQETQQTLKLIIHKEDKWPSIISNGTIMVVQKYYDSQIDKIPRDTNAVNSLYYRIVKSQDYALIKFSVTHFINFVVGCKQVADSFDSPNNPTLLQKIIERIKALTKNPVVTQMVEWKNPQKLSTVNNLNFGHFLLYHFKQNALELIEIYSQLDAYYSMAMASKKFSFCFPEIKVTSSPFVEAKQLYHPLVHTPTAYDVQLNQQGNFLFLTGANMAGKSTFIKAVGVSVYLAHVGMGVPAKKLELSLFDGLLSNIQVEDNITRGESYFFNEVQRIKKTIVKINDGRNWLILIDELFKGTNVQDAMKCSTAVIEGLRKMKNTLFILSTHLYEIGEELRQFSNIKFYYFETRIEEDQLIFSYQLKEGISNDRLGYLILRREGVVNMLHEL